MKTKQQEIYDSLAGADEAAGFFLKTPAHTSQAFIDYVEWTNTARRLDYGCVLDKFFTPPLPGDYITIMARPGHKKSTFMAALAKRYARQIVEAGQQDNEVVIYATWDEAVENIEGYITAEVGGFDAGDVAWGRLTKDKAIRGAVKRVNQLGPLWVWGVSIMDNERNKPPFTADWLFRTVQATHQKYGLKVKALFLDYLQIIPVTHEDSRMEEVTAASEAAKRLAKEIGCPVFAGVQAGRGVEGREDKMPGWADAQHASAIEQHSTKQLAVMSPIRYLDQDELNALNRGETVDPVKVAGNFYKINDDLTIVRILKQRGARGAGTYAIGIGQNTLNIYDPPRQTAESIRL